MKKLLPFLALTTIPLAAFPVVLAQDKKAQEGAPTAEQRLGALEAKVDELVSRELENEKQLDLVLSYLAKQAEAAGALLTELDTCEGLGFTAGINPQSREVLLSAFRGYYGAAQKDAPVQRAAKKDGEPKAAPAKHAAKNDEARAKRP